LESQFWRACQWQFFWDGFLTGFWEPRHGCCLFSRCSAFWRLSSPYLISRKNFNIFLELGMKISRLTKRIILFIGITALAFIIAGTIYYRSFQALPFALGVILTSSLNVLKIIMLERTANKVVNMQDPDYGKNFVRFQYLLRYFLTGIVLLVVGLLHYYTTAPFISIWGAVAGIFTMQIAVIVVRSMKNNDDT